MALKRKGGKKAASKKAAKKAPVCNIGGVCFGDFIPKYKDALSRGLTDSVGEPDGQMCIESAIAYSMGLPHNDQPKCVHPAIRSFKIYLNDNGRWDDDEDRAEGLREVGIAQLGTAGLKNFGPRFERAMALAYEAKILPAIRTRLLDDYNLSEADVTFPKKVTLTFADIDDIRAADGNIRDQIPNAATIEEFEEALDNYRTSSLETMVDNVHGADAMFGTNLTHELAAVTVDVLRDLKAPGVAWLAYARKRRLI